MPVLITLIILFAAPFAMVILRLTRRPASFAWVAAAFGALLSWGSVPFWQSGLPTQLLVSAWKPETLFNASPSLVVDSYAWVYAWSLSALAVAVILTSPARILVLSPISWIGSLILAIMAFLAVMANNPLTLVLAWTALDMTEFLNTIRSSDSPAISERAVISFAVRSAGTGFALWASLISSAEGLFSTFENTPPLAGLFMLLAVGLRLGVLPLHLTYRNDPGLRRGFGTSLRLTIAATSLVVLARLPVNFVEPRFVPVLLGLVALAAMYAGWKWLTLPDEISARPYWIIGMSALSLAAALRGSPEGSAAWGAALVLFGGLSFLYSSRQVWFSRLFAGLAILMLSLPFTLTASGWLGDFPLSMVFWPVFLAAHAMLVAGYVRHLFHAGETPFAELPRWAQAAYPVGLGALSITTVITGLWGWPGALQLGNWIIGLIMIALAGLVGLIFLRLRKFISPQQANSPSEAPVSSRFACFQDAVVGILWFFFRLVGRIMAYFANLLEGDGGLLWTLLLLVLFIAVLRGQK